QKIQLIPEDQAYLRYWCDLNFSQKVPAGKEEQYRARLEEEFDVFESKDFSSYMLIVADYVDYCRRNGKLVGPGRGCLSENTHVLTENGYKKLPEIEIGEKVYTHTGLLKEVTNKFKFPIKNEKLISFKIEGSFEKLALTSDHKV